MVNLWFTDGSVDSLMVSWWFVTGWLVVTRWPIIIDDGQQGFWIDRHGLRHVLLSVCFFGDNVDKVVIFCTKAPLKVELFSTGTTSHHGKLDMSRGIYNLYLPILWRSSMDRSQQHIWISSHLLAVKCVYVPSFFEFRCHGFPFTAPRLVLSKEATSHYFTHLTFESGCGQQTPKTRSKTVRFQQSHMAMDEVSRCYVEGSAGSHFLSNWEQKLETHLVVIPLDMAFWDWHCKMFDQAANHSGRFMFDD